MKETKTGSPRKAIKRVPDGTETKMIRRHRGDRTYRQLVAAYERAKALHTGLITDPRSSAKELAAQASIELSTMKVLMGYVRIRLGDFAKHAHRCVIGKEGMYVIYDTSTYAAKTLSTAAYADAVDAILCANMTIYAIDAYTGPVRRALTARYNAACAKREAAMERIWNGLKATKGLQTFTRGYGKYEFAFFDIADRMSLGGEEAFTSDPMIANDVRGA